MSKQGYASVNGLQMYYEIHGEGQPLVLIHGAFSGIGTSFGKLLPGLSEKRQVIAFELQAHGRTADIERPLTLEAMADDVAEGIRQLGLGQADILGYSMGAAVALHLVVRHPELVRKLIFASGTFKLSGVQPGLMEGLGEMKPEMMHGSPWHEEYMRIAPRPEDFNRLFAKKTAMDRQTKDIPEEIIRAIKSPTLIILGDSDLVQPEHAVEMFRLLGRRRLWGYTCRLAELSAGGPARHIACNRCRPRRLAGLDDQFISGCACKVMISKIRQQI